MYVLRNATCKLLRPQEHNSVTDDGRGWGGVKNSALRVGVAYGLRPVQFGSVRCTRISRCVELEGSPTLAHTRLVRSVLCAVVLCGERSQEAAD